jgi:site-specific recombinase XerD
MLKHYYPQKEKREPLEQNYLAPFIKEAARRFKEQDYPTRYARACLLNMSYFGDWLRENNIPVRRATFDHARAFTKQFVPPMFMDQPHRASTKRKGANRAAPRLAVVLIRKKYSTAVRRNPIQVEVDEYADHLARNRGLGEGTISNHKRCLKEFLEYYFAGEKVKIAELTASHIRDYFTEFPRVRQSAKGIKGAKERACTTLRSYFRFLELRGVPVKHLMVAVPVVSSPRRALSPRILKQEQLDQLLRSVDRSTAVGKRDYAAILCMCDLGMRVGDVPRLTLDDIDWRESSMRVANHKKDRPYRLPLPKRLGEAIADYLANGRPPSQFREIFLRHARPFGVPVAAHSLKSAVQRAWERAGLYGAFSGTHVLRHSAAARMKQKGVPLKSIADVLGHSSLQTTMLYAQVDLPALRRVAQPWPGGECHE